MTVPTWCLFGLLLANLCMFLPMCCGKTDWLQDGDIFEEIVWVNDDKAFVAVTTESDPGTVISVDAIGNPTGEELKDWGGSGKFRDGHPQGIAMRGDILYISSAEGGLDIVMFSLSNLTYIDGFDIPEVRFTSKLRQLAFNPSGSHMAIGVSINRDNDTLELGPVIYKFNASSDIIPTYEQTITRQSWSQWGGQGCTFISDYELLVSNGHEILKYDIRDLSSFSIFASFSDNKTQRINFAYNVVTAAALDLVRVLNTQGDIIEERETPTQKAQVAEISPNGELWYSLNNQLTTVNISSKLPSFEANEPNQPVICVQNDCTCEGQPKLIVEQECVNGTLIIVGDYEVPPSLVIDTGTITVLGDLIWKNGSTVTINGTVTFNIKGCANIGGAYLVVNDAADLPKNSTLINYNDTNCVVDSVPMVMVGGCSDAEVIRAETSALFLIVDDTECNASESSGTSTTKYFIGAFVAAFLLITIIVLVVLLILRPTWLFPFQFNS